MFCAKAFGEHGGVEVDTQGDAFFVAFATADGTAGTALAATERLRDGLTSVRMGLHTGAPTRTGEWYVGADVHRGARVAALAHGGQIVVSPTTAGRFWGSECAADEHGRGDLRESPQTLPLREDLSREFAESVTVGRTRDLWDAVSIALGEGDSAQTLP